MKKVAICIAGMPSDLDFSLPHIKEHILDPLNADLFMHMWHTSKQVSRSLRSPEHHDLDISQKKISNYVTPTRIEFQPYEDMESTFDKLAHDVTHAKQLLRNIPAYFSQWYSIKQVHSILKQYEQDIGYKYDIIIRLRTEIKFEKPITWEDLKHTHHRLIIPLGYGDGGRCASNVSLTGINDFMAFGNPHDMDIYTSMYDHIPQYCNDTRIIHSEMHLLYHLQQHDIKILRINFPGTLWKDDKCPHKPSWTPDPEYPGDPIE